jgi:thioredoxin 1
MKELLLSFIFCLLAGSVINGCQQSTTTPAPDGQEGTPAATQSTSDAGPNGAALVVEAGDETFGNEVLQSKQPVLVDFWADWCGPCKTMIPVVDELAGQYPQKLKVVRVDVDANEEVTNKYRISALPTFMIFVNGERKEKVVGAVPKQELETAIKKYVQ